MRDRFAAYGEAVANSVAIANRCHVEIPLGQNLLPTYSPIPEGLDADTYLRELCEAGMQERYADAVTAEVSASGSTWSSTSSARRGSRRIS